jgi:hypothetical protein
VTNSLVGCFDDSKSSVASSLLRPRSAMMPGI